MYIMWLHLKCCSREEHYVNVFKSKFFPKYLLHHFNETAADAAKVHVLFHSCSLCSWWILMCHVDYKISVR